MKILIVKTSAIGDVIQTFPVLAYLKEKFPTSTIDWVVEKTIGELLASHPHVSRVILIDTKKWRKALFNKETWRSIKKMRERLQEVEYDLLFDLQGNSKSSIFTLFARSKKKIGYSFKTLPEKVNWFATSYRYAVPLHLSIQEQYLSLVQSHFNASVSESVSESEIRNSDLLGHALKSVPFSHATLRLKGEKLGLHCDKPALMVCFGSRWTNKQLPKTTLLELLKLVKGQFPLNFLFVFGNEEEQGWAEELNAAFPGSQMMGGLTLSQLQNLMHEVEAVLSMDSATLHLCGTTPTPSFSLFGPSSAHVYKPMGEQHVAFQGSCPYGTKFVKRCPVLRTCKTGACMKDLTALEIFQELAKFLSKCSMVSLVSPKSSSSERR